MYQNKVQSPDSPPERDVKMAEAIYLAMSILRMWVDWMAPRMVSMKEQTTGCRMADSLGG